MPNYVLLSTLTNERRQTMHAQPERLEALNKEIEELGCRVLSQYAVLGGYDFVAIVEAPGNEVAAHLSVDLGSRGDCGEADEAADAIIGKYSCLHKCRPMRINIKQAEQSCTRL